VVSTPLRMGMGASQEEVAIAMMKTTMLPPET
jgi:hypothetical protein